MSFTYEISTDRGKVRLAIGDVIDMTTDNESLSDAEVDYALSLSSDLDAAALRCCEWLVARLRHKIGSTAGGVSSNQREKIDGLETLRAILEKRIGKGRVTAYFGGISEARVDSTASDTDFAEPRFKVGMDDLEGSGD